MDRYRWRSIGVVIAFYVVNLVLMITSQAAERTAWLRYFTYFSCYKPERIIQFELDPQNGSPWQVWIIGESGMAELGPFGFTIVMLSIGAVCYAFAFIRFGKRDLPAPV